MSIGSLKAAVQEMMAALQGMPIDLELVFFPYWLSVSPRFLNFVNPGSCLNVMMNPWSLKSWRICSHLLVAPGSLCLVTHNGQQVPRFRSTGPTGASTWLKEVTGVMKFQPSSWCPCWSCVQSRSRWSSDIVVHDHCHFQGARVMDFSTRYAQNGASCSQIRPTCVVTLGAIMSIIQRAGQGRKMLVTSAHTYISLAVCCAISTTSLGFLLVVQLLFLVTWCLSWNWHRVFDA